ncbi:hypothetical protein K491DRAFT_714899 [Lophiostoma macrostomum CBS 122681]|uniref:Uncharacterized protein n=1 Tax=Lophiostoma macrostomum CBS 122681 TaxID=1314788 RepID=A0A6A6TCI3_9PLEO|nr:hypothetical protein K491DRAFT_714899 [Lophiostoma macrostomum CBS 122681]
METYTRDNIAEVNSSEIITYSEGSQMAYLEKAYKNGDCFCLGIPFPSDTDEESMLIKVLLDYVAITRNEDEEEDSTDGEDVDEKDGDKDVILAADSKKGDNDNDHKNEENDKHIASKLAVEQKLIAKLDTSNTLSNFQDYQAGYEALYPHAGFLAAFWHDRDIISASRIQKLRDLHITQEQLAEVVMKIYCSKDEGRLLNIPECLFPMTNTKNSIVKLEQFIIGKISGGESGLGLLWDETLVEELGRFQEGYNKLIYPHNRDPKTVLYHLEWMTYEWHRHHYTKFRGQARLANPICPRIKAYEKADIQKLAERLHELRTVEKNSTKKT